MDVRVRQTTTTLPLPEFHDLDTDCWHDNDSAIGF